MAKRLFSVHTFTPTAQADGVLTATTYAVIGGGVATDFISISDIVQAGQATSSAFNNMTLSHSSALGITPTALSLAGSPPASDGFVRTPAPAITTAPINYVAAGTAPNRSPAVTLPRLMLGFNAFGCTFRLAFAPGSEWMSLGAGGSAAGVTSQSENVFSSMNVGTAGAQSLSVTYEML